MCRELWMERKSDRAKSDRAKSDGAISLYIKIEKRKRKIVIV